VVTAASRRDDHGGRHQRCANALQHLIGLRAKGVTLARLWLTDALLRLSHVGAIGVNVQHEGNACRRRTVGYSPIAREWRMGESDSTIDVGAVAVLRH